MAESDEEETAGDRGAVLGRMEVGLEAGVRWH